MSQVQNGGPNAPPGKKREFTAYKLIVDPALVKGAFKVYRFDGVIPGDPSYPSILLRDPRKQKNLRKPVEPMILPVPAFKIDINYVGEIPPTEVTFTNLNDNVGEIFLANLSSKFGLVEDVSIYHHPISHRHLGFGHVVFKSSRDAKTCVEKLNATYVMGQKVNVHHDPGGKKCKELFVEVTTQKPGGAAKDDKKGGSGAAPVTVAKPPIPPPNKLTSSSKQNHMSESRHYKDDLKSTPHDGASIASASSDDRKSFISSSTPSSSKTSSRSRDRDSGDVFKRFNINYERYEPNNASAASSNYGYPIPPGSSRTPSLSSTHSSMSNFHHQQTSLPSSPLVTSSVGGSSSTRSDSYVNNNNSDKVVSEGEVSPKIDLDTRIKLLLEGRNSGELGKLFTDGNISASSESESDTEASPLKRARLSLGSASATIWDSESEEESKEASFARKFKQSFVPVNDVDVPPSRGPPTTAPGPANPMLSPPPSPFLSFSTNSASKSVKGKADPEFDQISDDEDGQLGEDKDDMSLSSLSPDADSSSRIKQDSRITQPPLPPNSVHSTYYGEYYNNTYPPNYHMPPWSGGQGQGSPSEVQGHHPQSSNHDYNNSYNQGYYQQQTAPPKPEVKVEKQEDHKNPNLLINALIEYMVDDLKKVLRRDCHRRLIETEAFKLYEDWWAEEEKELKRKQDEENAKSLPTPSIEPVAVAPIAENVENGMGLGLGFRNIPKLPSFRRKIELPTPVADEDSRKSYLDSDDDSLTSSDEEEVRGARGRRSKARFSFSSDEESDASSVSSKSTVSEPPDVTDAEAISTTEDEDEFSDSKVHLDSDYKIPPTPKIETEDILSDDDSPEESGAVPDEEEGSLGICDRTGRMIIKHLTTKSPDDESIPLPKDVVLPPPPVPAKQVVDEEMEEGVLEDVNPIPTEPLANILPPPPIQAKLNEYITPELNDEKPIIIPYDAMRPRGDKKSKTLAFRPRIDYEILDIVYEFLKEGIDGEDIQYFQKAYELLLCDDSLYWLNSTHWVDHPQTVIKKKPTTPIKKKGRKKKEVIPDSEEGSIRTRGFVRMTKEEKTRAMDGKQQPVLMALGNDKGDFGKSRETQIREARCNQRRILTALGTESDLLKFNQLQFRKKALRFARSGIHEWGLFAAEPIAADEMVIEYVGQMIRPVVADLRETKYEAQGIGSSYLFRIDLETIIDATRCGNLSRFINHSCNPNCYAKVITIEGKKKIVIYSKQPIAVSEEITYDYKFPLEDKKIPCLCGTAGCRGTLN
ncbi:Histone-lysine N-methyltransferase SETD1 [Orchesella cincta]|uniref:[histone H3]-lysine(4) N-trimethyltransferase n=1 Tax=Orchesella cincta TaxID=48709 RepID=A0A1D2NIY9_ORCCI|nr:Histone-lysine N-methyltransferase SETD1 [Orchesella cincta]